VSPWKVILATMVIFVCGVVTGALVIKTQGWHPPAPYSSGGPPGPASVRAFMDRLDRAKMSLTINQRDKIEKIMQDSQATNSATGKIYFSLMQKEKERAQKAITQLLTTEQQTIFAELLKEHDQRPGGRGEGLRDGRGRRGGEGGGGFPRSTNRFQSNGLPDEGRGRMGRRGPVNNISTNGPGDASRILTDGLPESASGKLEGTSPSNNPSTSAP